MSDNIELNLVDLRAYDFKKGNCLIYEDKDFNQVIVFLDDVKRGDDSLTSILVGRVYTASGGSYTPNERVELTVSKVGRPLLGKVIDYPEEKLQAILKKISVQGKFSPDDSIVYELVRTIRMSERLQITTKDAITFLERTGFIDNNLSYEAKKERIKRLLILYPHVIRRAGQFLRLVDVSKMKGTAMSKNDGNKGTTARVVDKKKLFEGIDLIIESGILGDIVYRMD